MLNSETGEPRYISDKYELEGFELPVSIELWAHYAVQDCDQRSQEKMSLRNGRYLNSAFPSPEHSHTDYFLDLHIGTR